MKIRRFTHEGQPAVEFTFDSPEGKGEIICQPVGYGLYFRVNGRCLGLIDLYYFGQEWKEDPVTREESTPNCDYPRVVLYDRDSGDALGTMEWPSKDEAQFRVEFPCEVDYDPSARAPVILYKMGEPEGVKQ